MNRHLLTLAPPVRRAQRRLLERCSYLLSLARPYQPLAGGKQLLDTEYAEGVWGYLKGLDELPRFSVVAGYCHHFAAGGSILEIGCGAGTLQERLCPGRYSRYVGVDISSEALARAAHRQSSSVAFVQADATEFAPEENFDAIVFNECLEYFATPASLVRRYEAFLNPEAPLIVSMFVSKDNARTRKIWKDLERGKYIAAASTCVSNQHEYTWLIKVLLPPTACQVSEGDHTVNKMISQCGSR